MSELTLDYNMAKAELTDSETLITNRLHIHLSVVLPNIIDSTYWDSKLV